MFGGASPNIPSVFEAFKGTATPDNFFLSFQYSDFQSWLTASIVASVTAGTFDDLGDWRPLLRQCRKTAC